MSFNPDWCRQENLRCEECPIRDLELIDEGVAEHTIDMVKQYGIGDIVQSINDGKNHHDARYTFELFVGLSGIDIQRYYAEKSGYELASAAILRMAQVHVIH